MRSFYCRTALLLCLVLALPVVASAQDRDFSGRVDRISATKLIVDNRMNDKVTFVKVDETVVVGAKSEWGQIRPGDWVTVSWKMTDKPRKAYRIRVQPPRRDEAD